MLPSPATFKGQMKGESTIHRIALLWENGSYFSASLGDFLRSGGVGSPAEHGQRFPHLEINESSSHDETDFRFCCGWNFQLFVVMACSASILQGSAMLPTPPDPGSPPGGGAKNSPTGVQSWGLHHCQSSSPAKTLVESRTLPKVWEPIDIFRGDS